ncbi:MAG: bifunctional diaminohydroxyphosphoribosylaminopyrimidine deaminase/5-amino-6-(5-phosphoribosylamino)uracil reductase RibD [Planctomycetales bacterium]|nr:bifunctional diaminohydroxyphosphoribosylaminopyrimidine deaminase/5-amino-6-(5-phosphoribosylamino)uracil reductase RibD [Planctomycetales bacterium]
MRQALNLARRGLGSVEPNPAVGCVIVKDGAVIGQGWHRRFGGPHAEVNAISDCRKQGHIPDGATMYVTLEPCAHFGKTPPCTQAVIAAGLKKIVIASEDPTRPAGGGIRKLKDAGIEVEAGVCRDEAESLNAPFYKHARTELPWIILKWAQSIDGKLAWKNPPEEGRWISNEKSRADVHRLRKRVQGILTGVDTVIADNPKLTLRIEAQPIDRPPLRIVLDSNLRMPLDCHLTATTDASTLLVTTHNTAKREIARVEKFKQAGVEVLAASQREGRCDLRETLMELGKRDIQQLLVEAGPTLIAEFLKQRLVDEIRTYIAPMILGTDGAADISKPLSAIVTRCKFKNIQIEPFDMDICISGRL